MALIRRGDVNRPLTIEEVDGNFDYLEGLALSGSGPTGPAGNNGVTGPTGPAGSTASISLQNVTDVSYVTTTGILIDNPYGSSQYSTPYTGGSPQLRFFTSGDGVEFSDILSMSLNMNIEEWFAVQAIDDGGFSNSLQLSPYQTLLTYDGNDGFSTLSLNGSGVGIEGIISGVGDYSANITDLDYAQKIYVDSIRPYKAYTSLISQSGTNAPTEIILENSDDYFSLSWQRDGTGNYFATSTGSFTVNKTAVFITPNLGGHHFVAYSPNANEIWIEVTQTIAVGPYNAIGVDSILSNVSFEIRVYP
jgi:hypothetical protein